MSWYGVKEMVQIVEGSPEIEVLSIQKFCKTFHISKSHFYKLFHEGEMPMTITIGKRRFITKNSMHAWLHQAEEKALSQQNPSKPTKPKKVHSAVYFDEFWKIYPIKKNRSRAEKIWLSKNLDAIADKLIEDVKNRLYHDASWQDKQYIPHGNNYLRDQRWEDEIVTNPNKSSWKNTDVARRLLEDCLER